MRAHKKRNESKKPKHNLTFTNPDAADAAALVAQTTRQRFLINFTSLEQTVARVYAVVSELTIPRR